MWRSADPVAHFQHHAGNLLHEFCGYSCGQIGDVAAGIVLDGVSRHDRLIDRLNEPDDLSGGKRPRLPMRYPGSKRRVQRIRIACGASAGPRMNEEFSSCGMPSRDTFDIICMVQ